MKHRISSDNHLPGYIIHEIVLLIAWLIVGMLICIKGNVPLLTFVSVWVCLIIELVDNIFLHTELHKREIQDRWESTK